MTRTLAAAAVIGLVLMLAIAGPAGGRSATTIHFSFQTYANNVRVVAPLVGAWQLGTARLHGSGLVGDGRFLGTVVDFTDPLRARFPSASMTARIVGYRFEGGAHGSYRKLTLTVEIESATNGGQNCDPGTRGVVTLYDSAQTISNGERADYVVMGHWAGARCPTFVQGWTNEDGGARTSPAHGGPHGGQWAVVNISST
jgi:hypothetical protein